MNVGLNGPCSPSSFSGPMRLAVLVLLAACATAPRPRVVAAPESPAPRVEGPKPAPPPPPPLPDLARFGVPAYHPVEKHPERGELAWVLKRAIDLVQIECVVRTDEEPRSKSRPIDMRAPRVRVRCAESHAPLTERVQFYGVGAQNGASSYLPRIRACFRPRIVSPTPRLLRALEAEHLLPAPNGEGTAALRAMARPGRPLLEVLVTTRVTEGHRKHKLCPPCERGLDCCMGPVPEAYRFERSITFEARPEAIDGENVGAPVFPETRHGQVVLLESPEVLAAARANDWKTALEAARPSESPDADARFVAWTNRAIAAHFAGDHAAFAEALTEASKVKEAATNVLATASFGALRAMEDPCATP